MVLVIACVAVSVTAAVSRWGVGQLPVCPARQCSERLGALLQKRCWANWGSWWVACSSVIRMWGAGKRARDFPSAPRMQTGMKTPWRCLMEPQPWLGREGEVRLAGAGTRDAEPRHSVQARALPHQLWELRTLGNGGLSPPGPAQRTNRQCLWEGLWGQAGGQAETRQHSLCKKSPFSQAAGRASPMQ